MPGAQHTIGRVPCQSGLQGGAEGLSIPIVQIAVSLALPRFLAPGSVVTVAIDGVVSLCPLSSDMTARTGQAELAAWG